MIFWDIMRQLMHCQVRKCRCTWRSQLASCPPSQRSNQPIDKSSSSQLFFVYDKVFISYLLLTQQQKQIKMSEDFATFLAAFHEELSQFEADFNAAFKSHSPYLYPLFAKFYEYIAEDPNYTEIVNFHEQFWAKEKLRQDLEMCVISNWIHAQLGVVKSSLLEDQTLVPWLVVRAEEKIGLENIVGSLQDKLKLTLKEYEALLENIIQSPICKQVSEYLLLEVWPESKINEKHQELRYIMNLMKRGKDIPEVELQRHILVAFEQKYSRSSPEGEEAKSSLVPIQRIEESLKQAKRLAHKVKQKLGEWQTAKDGDRFVILEGVKAELTTVDVYSLKRLIELSNENLNQDQEKKDLLLLIGPTGSGKTTIILKCLGYELEETKIKGLRTLQPKGVRPEHAALRCSPESTSTTRYLFATRLPPDSMPPGDHNNVVHICDTPGFGDTAGVQVDISNSIGILKGLKQCRSVKLVIVISQGKIGDKYQGIKSLAKIVSNLVIKVKEIEKNVEFLFNKFVSNEQAKNLRPAVKNILQNLQPAELSNVEYKVFLQCLLAKLKGDNYIRFDPLATNIPDLISDLSLDSKIVNTDIFKYSISPDSEMAITSRKFALLQQINLYLGKRNNLVHYYLKELELLGDCLPVESSLIDSIENVRRIIRERVADRFRLYEEKLNEILRNDSNRSTFEELTKISEEINGFEVFTDSVPGMVTSKDVKEMIIRTKDSILENMKELNFTAVAFEETRKQIFNIFKFFGLFYPERRQEISDILLNLLQEKKKELTMILQTKEYNKLAQVTTELNNICLCIQAIKDAQNPESGIKYSKSELLSIKAQIRSHFDAIVSAALTSFKSRIEAELDPSFTTNINEKIDIFYKLEDYGQHILDDIMPKQFRAQIINGVTNYIRSIIEESETILSFTDEHVITERECNIIRRNRINTMLLKEIPGVQEKIGTDAVRLWASFTCFIKSEKRRLTNLLEDLKTNRKIDKRTLKDFQVMTDRVIKFSENDYELANSTNQLKSDIKRELMEHVRKLKTQVDNLKISIKGKNSMNAGEVGKEVEKYYQIFKEIEAFFKIKQFKNNNFLAIENDVEASKWRCPQDEIDSDDDDLNMATTIVHIRAQIIQKLLKPYLEINKASKQENEKPSSGLSDHFLQKLQSFLIYTRALEDKYLIISNNTFIEERKKLMECAESYTINVKNMLEKIKVAFQSFSVSSAEIANCIHMLQQVKVKEFKTIINSVVKLNKYPHVEEFFMDFSFHYEIYMSDINVLLEKSHSQISDAIASYKKQAGLTNRDDLLKLLNQTQRMKIFNGSFLHSEFLEKFEFAQLAASIEEILAKIEGKHANEISNLFRCDNIIIPEIVRTYNILKSSASNSDKLLVFYDNLKEYGRNLKKNLDQTNRIYSAENIMLFEGSASLNYLKTLERTLKFYKDFSEFIDPGFLESFAINEDYFRQEFDDMRYEQRVKHTYNAVKEKLLNFQYKSKPKEFHKIFSLIQKAEDIVETASKCFKDTIFTNYYESGRDEEELKEAHLLGSNFCQRLKYYQDKISSQFNIKENGHADSKYIEEVLSRENFKIYYQNAPNQEKEIIHVKLESAMNDKFEEFANSYIKPVEEKKAIEENIKAIIKKLPISTIKTYQERLKEGKANLEKREEKLVLEIRQELREPSLSNLSKLVTKYNECKNEIIQKEISSMIKSQLTFATKQICVYEGQSLKLFDSYKKYLRFYGPQNIDQMLKVVENGIIRQLFELEQKHLYGSFLEEQKDLISEIEGSFLRPAESNLKQFELKCAQINQVYTLSLEHEYSGFCPKEHENFLRKWEEYVIKMREKIALYERRDHNEISSRIEMEKDIVSLCLIRTFIDSLLHSIQRLRKEKSTRYQFIYETFQRYQKIAIDREIMHGYKLKLRLTMETLKNVSFYDDIIKVLTSSQLQSQFEKNLVDGFKYLEEYKEIYNKYLLAPAQQTFSMDKLTQTVQNKWEAHLKVVFSQSNEALTHMDNEVSSKLQVTYNIARIEAKKSWKLIDKNLDAQTRIEQYIEEMIERVKVAFKQHETKIAKFIEQKKSIDLKYSDQKKKVETFISKKEEAVNLQTQKIKKQIDAADDELKGKLSLELLNVKALANDEIDKFRDEKYKLYQGEQQKNSDLMKEYIQNSILKDAIAMKKITHSINWKSRDGNAILAAFLEMINKQDRSINAMIYSALESSKNQYALIIAAESLIFKNQAAQLFKTKTQKQDINYVLDNCRQIQQQKELRSKILRSYRIYEDEYNGIIQRFIQRPHKEEIDSVARMLRDHKDKVTKNIDDSVPTPTIIARIFAVWSMMKTDLSGCSEFSIDFQPHPAQVVAIFLLIGFKDQQTNSLVQILTGQGKSIVLAGLCCYLAIKNYYPYCACYSQYLSSRDEREFKELFDILQVSNRIKYGTFNEHCENIINQASEKTESDKAISFRDRIKSFITNQSLSKNILSFFSKLFDASTRQNCRKVLIIDEADVFFSENFYGQLYCPSISLDGEEVRALIEAIWRLTKTSRESDSVERLSKQQVQAMPEFKKLNAKYPSISKLLQCQISGMLQAVYNYTHTYTIHQNALKYLENDSITDKISYGYKTVFANCFEYERKSVSELSYRAALKITFNIAPFSYCELPNFFQSILGVSGTISSISESKRTVLRQKYKIAEMYEVPSIYGQNNRAEDMYQIVKSEQFYSVIVKQAHAVISTGRPVAIFFRTIKEIINFYKSAEFNELIACTTILSEETDHESREIIIKRVGQRGKITISSDSFTRGTDFKVFEKSLNESGGLHVIQTYISPNYAEHIQIKGRTARQGNKGSYEMLVNETELERFQINCEDSLQLYDRIEAAWKKRDLDEYKQLEKRAKAAQSKHKLSESVFTESPNLEKLLKFMQSQNQYLEIVKNNVKTLIAVDGTSSMIQAIEKVKSILEVSFLRAKAILETKKVNGSFENQVAIYRNYNSDFQQILEYSGFEANSEKLKEFMNKIQVSGGWGNEAVEVMFQYANKLSNLNQIILITDARANRDAEVRYKRERMGEKYWIESGFPLAYDHEEIAKLKAKGIKIHTLYIKLESGASIKNKDLEEYCQRISRDTDGTAAEFKVKEETASDFLTGFLVKNILSLIGGSERGSELMEEYDASYGSVPLRL